VIIPGIGVITAPEELHIRAVLGAANAQYDLADLFPINQGRNFG
jgi:hypothetical protein